MATFDLRLSIEQARLLDRALITAQNGADAALYDACENIRERLSMAMIAMADEYRETLKRRFNSRIKSVPGSLDTPCHEWTGKKHVKGYGIMRIEGRQRQATHISHFLATGHWPSQMNHLCRNNSCVRSDHIYAGTQMENMRDRDRDGTTSRGHQHLWGAA